MTNQMEKKEIYTTANLAEVFQVSERTILEHIRNSEMKAHKRFKKWYVTHDDLMDFVKTAETNLNENEKEKENE